MSEQDNPLSQEEITSWVREHYQAATKYLAQEGVIADVVHIKQSRYLAPHVAVWRFTTMDKKDLWVINGDVPTDLVHAKVADDARSVMRHFALQWQLQAEAILRNEKADHEQRGYAEYLIQRAEAVYQTTSAESLWQQTD